jgi:hypothetical protein
MPGDKREAETKVQVQAQAWGQVARLFACRVLRLARSWSAAADGTCSVTRVTSTAIHEHGTRRTPLRDADITPND